MGREGGGICNLRIDPGSGALSLINQEPTYGKDPCHICVDAQRSRLYVSNYSSGSLSVFALGADGSLSRTEQQIRHEGSGPNPSRQEAAHLHSSILDPTGRFLLTADLGIDQVNVYQPQAGSSLLVDNQPPFHKLEPGSGPRHMTWAANRRTLYVVNELASSLSVMDFDPVAGQLTLIETHALLPEDFLAENTAADLHLSGDFLYVSNRGHDSLVQFRVIDPTGRLEFVERVPSGGATPRNFATSPDGAWLLAANQNSDSIQVFAIDPLSGKLGSTGEPLSVPLPVCILFA
jgi:6-phosphogluconolactonase